MLESLAKLSNILADNQICYFRFPRILIPKQLFRRSEAVVLQMFFKIGVLTNFGNFTGKHLCWSLLLKKRLNYRCFPVKFSTILRINFSEHLQWRIIRSCFPFSLLPPCWFIERALQNGLHPVPCCEGFPDNFSIEHLWTGTSRSNIQTTTSKKLTEPDQRILL